MNIALACKFCAYLFSQLRENVRPGIVYNCVYGIESQPVEVILLQPIQRIVNVEIAYRTAVRTIEVDRLSPWSFVPLGKELRRIQPKVIALRTEMVIDHIQKHH